MTTLYDLEEIERAPHATILLQLVLDPKRKKYRALIDSRASLSLAPHFITSPSGWQSLETPIDVSTKTGYFPTGATITVEVMMPDFSTHWMIKFTFHQDTSRNSRYDFILGRDFLQATGMTLNYQDEVFEWDGVTVPMPVACQAVQEVEEKNEGDEVKQRFVSHQDIYDNLPKTLTTIQNHQLL
jgi:hypothetical protein